MVKTKIIHIVRDEKFIDFAFNLFNSYSDVKNTFVIIGNRNHSLKYIKKANVFSLSPVQFALMAPLFHFFYKGLILHGIEGEFLKASILKMSKSLRILWIGYGYDYYSFTNIETLKVKTSSLLRKLNPSNINYKKSYFLKIYTHRFNDKKFLERVNYFAPVIEEDFRLFESVHLKSKFKFIDWNYLTLEDDVIKGFEDRRVFGNNILLGNSGGSANNHLDAFEDIKLFNINFDRIVCPLSYGNISYRETIGEMGAIQFGKKFIALNAFLNYDDYVNVLLTCEYVFINSLRQLGMGNLVLMLYLGAKVILDKSNPSYNFFLNNNIKVFSIEEACFGNFGIIDLEKTRFELKRIWGKDIIYSKTRNLLNLF